MNRQRLFTKQHFRTIFKEILDLKNSKGIILVFASSICALLLVLFVFMHERKINSEPEPVSVSVANEIETTSIDLSQYQINNRIINLGVSSDSIPASASIDVPFVDQNPELPTGCEITSLTEVLNYYGFNVNKEYMARNYLPMSEVTQPGCFIEYFLGSPWKSNGSGCFAPAIIKAANNFFKDNSSHLQAISMSYSSIESLFEQIANGYPVIVWTCFDYDIDEIEYKLITYDNGSSFYWPSYEHCVVLSGYDLEAQTVTLADPTYGIVEQSIDDFESYYQKFFYQAVVVK